MVLPLVHEILAAGVHVALAGRVAAPVPAAYEVDRIPCGQYVLIEAGLTGLECELDEPAGADRLRERAPGLGPDVARLRLAEFGVRVDRDAPPMQVMPAPDFGSGGAAPEFGRGRSLQLVRDVCGGRRGGLNPVDHG